MVKSKLTVRLTPETDAWVEQEARRTGRSKGAIVEGLAEEAARTRRFPGIGFRGAAHDRRAWLRGTGLEVWEVIEAYQDAGSLEALLTVSDLDERLIRLAMSYYAHYPAEIDQAVADNRRSDDELHVLFPTIVPRPT
jgi:uncharacterized protein (DUF433 family)